jgi:hypothetical protein
MLGLTSLRSELGSHYSSIGRPSIDLDQMIRMLVAGMFLRSARSGGSAAMYLESSQGVGSDSASRAPICQ